MKNYITLSALSLLIVLLVSCSEQQRPTNTSTGTNTSNGTNTSSGVIEEPILPTSCVDENEGTSVITYISTNSGSADSSVTIEGCNFSGFEGDKNVWIENEQGIKGIIYGNRSSTSKIIDFSLKPSLCQNDNSYSGLECDAWLTLVPGKYKIYVNPWGKQSNKVDFTVTNEITTNAILKELFVKKYPNYSDTIVVNINEKTSDFARGGVIFETGAPGGNFLAAKVNDKWEIVFDGNGQIPCDLSKYGFPEYMLLDCAK